MLQSSIDSYQLPLQVAWGIASSGVRRIEAMKSLASEMMCRDGFSLQAIANITWAFKTLEIQNQQPLSAHLEGLVARRLIEAKGIPAPEDVDSLLGILWANRENQGLTAAVTNSLQCLGRKMDALGSREELPSRRPEAGEGPQVALQAPGVVVIVKPQDWEVDTVCTDTEDADPSSPSGPSDRKLSNYIDGLKLGFKAGFIGRLDTPSSGLLLHATSFEGLFMLQAQRELGLLERDYLVLCHAWLPAELFEISAKLRRVGREAEVSPYGRPACTQVKLLAHLTMDSGPVSLLAVRIVSGRMHQIRCHLAHVGHPVVGDRRYSKEAHEAR